MEVNGWKLLQYKLFTDQLNQLISEVEAIKLSQPDLSLIHI